MSVLCPCFKKKAILTEKNLKIHNRKNTYSEPIFKYKSIPFSTLSTSSTPISLLSSLSNSKSDTPKKLLFHRHSF